MLPPQGRPEPVLGRADLYFDYSSPTLSPSVWVNISHNSETQKRLKTLIYNTFTLCIYINLVTDISFKWTKE